MKLAANVAHRCGYKKYHDVVKTLTKLRRNDVDNTSVDVSTEYRQLMSTSIETTSCASWDIPFNVT